MLTPAAPRTRTRPLAKDTKSNGQHYGVISGSMAAWWVYGGQRGRRLVPSCVCVHRHRVEGARHKGHTKRRPILACGQRHHAAVVDVYVPERLPWVADAPMAQESLGPRGRDAEATTYMLQLAVGVPVLEASLSLIGG
eukprot:2456032-Prymnesium_polylepis.3